MEKLSPVEPIEVKKLHFDYNNPRLAEYGIDEETGDSEILKVLWETMDVRELVQSIHVSGFFPHEPLYVVKEGGKNIVIEGNRRLAAVKILLDPELAKKNGWDVPDLSESARADLQSLPVVMSKSREALWRFLGFRHVNGPAKWSSYAKATYIAEVHHKWGIPLAQIAEQIGDYHNTVQRLYRGLMVLEQAEKKGVYNRADSFRTKLAFSHLYTGLDYEEISRFLELADKSKETKNPVPTKKIKALGELLTWLYGSKKEKVAPVVQSQNPHLRQLSAVIGKRESLAALRAGEDLSRAFELSRPSSTILEESLLTGKRSLTTAQSHITTGYDKSEALLRIAGSVADIADDVYEQMRQKREGKGKKIAPRLS